MPKQEEISWYLTEIRKFPLLNARKEKSLALRIQRNGDEKARQEMIRCNLRLVVSIARKFMNRGVPLSDLIADGNIGLVRAVELFDPKKDVRFSTYAMWWIRQAIRRGMMLSARPIRVPVYMAQRISQLQGISRIQRNRFGDAEDKSELAGQMNTSLRSLALIERATHTMQNANTSSQEHPGLHLQDMLMDRRTPPPGQAMETVETIEIVQRLLGQLKEKESQIIQLRHGLCGKDPLTLEEIARQFGVTRERIRQIELVAIKKLGRMMQGREYMMHTPGVDVRGTLYQVIAG
jgi:RNA polymerase primary sigma factor